MTFLPIMCYDINKHQPTEDVEMMTKSTRFFLLYEVKIFGILVAEIFFGMK